MKGILLVEDDNQLRSVIAEILTESGYSVIQAIDGKQAVELYNTTPIDLVISDLIMPDKDGIDLIIELRQNSPQLKIIAISGGMLGDSISSLRSARAVGAQAVLSKPFEIEELLDLVKKVLEE